MSEVAEQVIACVTEVEKNEEKLVILAAKPGAGKSRLMREMGQLHGWKYLDSKTLFIDELLEMPPKIRGAEASLVMSDILAREDAKVILLDNIQVLFAPVLKIDPLNILRQMSHTQTIVAAWPGEYVDGNLIYLRNFGTEPVKYSGEGLHIITLE